MFDTCRADWQAILNRLNTAERMEGDNGFSDVLHE